VETSNRARFNPLIRPYLVVTGAVFLTASLVGIPLAVIWLCGVGQWWARHYFDRLECELDERTLRYRKGILFQVEKTIPLENIQDVTFTEGPILKRFNLSILKFETAGQSAGKSNEMQLIGIIDAHAFRAQIMAARQKLRERQHAGEHDLNAALAGIQSSLDRIVALLEKR
jgi:membrane protein YdbS with pleckstrin-like domain